jgi:DNA primase
MGKISPVSAKYIVHATIEINGVVDRPDVIGAIFGQTEGLLGAELELRELQRSGRIGRIEVNVETTSGKTKGNIQIPSSLDKSETSIVGAALEVIDRIGPCESKISVGKIEDVRVAKRDYIIQRAKSLLKDLMDKTMPDSQQIADEVAESVRVMEIVNFGKERLPAGPAVEDSDEIIIVEGRADVINLLKIGIKNSIAMNGTNAPESIKALTKKKEVTVFVDGDRGGDLIIKELLGVGQIDFICKAPDGKEVEEITKKEIHQALRAKVSAEQYRLDHHISAQKKESRPESKPVKRDDNKSRSRPVVNSRPSSRPLSRPVKKEDKLELSDEDKKKFSEIADELVGTRGAFLLDDSLQVLGKVPLPELSSTLGEIEASIYALVLDGAIDKDLVSNARKSGIQLIIGKEIASDIGVTKIKLVLAENL